MRRYWSLLVLGILLPGCATASSEDRRAYILAHPHVATIFLIPGVRETLRVNGRATIHDEPEILDRCLINGRRPITVTRIAVDEAYLHCAKALIRSRLWHRAMTRRSLCRRT